MMKIYKRSLIWFANCKTLLLLAVFSLEVSTVKAGNEHVFTDIIPIVEPSRQMELRWATRNHWVTDLLVRKYSIRLPYPLIPGIGKSFSNLTTCQ